MPKPRKVDTTERCAACGKRGARNEMLLWDWHESKLTGERLWFHPDCWPADKPTKRGKDGE